MGLASTIAFRDKHWRVRVPVNDDTLFGPYRGALRLDPHTLRLHLCFGPTAPPSHARTGLVVHRISSPAPIATIVDADTAAWLCRWWKEHGDDRRAYDCERTYAQTYGLPGAFVQLSAADVCELRRRLRALCAYARAHDRAPCYETLDDLVGAPTDLPPIVASACAVPAELCTTWARREPVGPSVAGGVAIVPASLCCAISDSARRTLRESLLGDPSLRHLPLQLFACAPRLLDAEMQRSLRVFGAALAACADGKDPDRLLKPHLEQALRPIACATHVFDVDDAFVHACTLREWYAALLTLNDAMPVHVTKLESQRLHEAIARQGGVADAVEVGWHNDGGLQLVRRALLRAKACMLHVALTELELKSGGTVASDVPRWNTRQLRTNVKIDNFRVKGDGAFVSWNSSDPRGDASTIFDDAHFVGVTREGP